MSPFSLPGFGPLPWIDVVLIGWFVLTAVSVVYVAWDNFVNRNPENAVIELP